MGIRRTEAAALRRTLDAVAERLREAERAESAGDAPRARALRHEALDISTAGDTSAVLAGGVAAGSSASGSAAPGGAAHGSAPETAEHGLARAGEAHSSTPASAAPRAATVSPASGFAIGGAASGSAVLGGAASGSAMRGGATPGGAAPGSPASGSAAAGSAAPGGAVLGGASSGGAAPGGAASADGDATPAQRAALERGHRLAKRPTLRRDDISKLHGDRAEGKRILALGILQRRPDLASFEVVSEAVSESRDAFEHAQGLAAAQTAIAAKALSADEATRLKEQIGRDLASGRLDGTARAGLAQHALDS